MSGSDFTVTFRVRQKVMVRVGFGVRFRVRL